MARSVCRRGPAAGRRLAGALAGLAALAGAGCAASPVADGQPLQVVASMSIIADFAAEVGGDHVEVRSLVPVGGDPHVYEPTPSDARAVQDADVVLGNGVGLEPWFDALADGSGREVVTVTDAVAQHVVEDDEGEPDPHLWMVPPKAAAYVEAVADALSQADPEHADDYAASAARYAERLQDLDDELASALDAVPPDNRILVTSHDAYAYFAGHYGFEVDTVVGVSSEEEPSAAAVQRLVDRVREQEVPTVFVETTVEPSVIERIARDTGAEVGRPLYGDSVGEEGSGAETYPGMMRANVEALVDGLAS